MMKKFLIILSIIAIVVVIFILSTPSSRPVATPSLVVALTPASTTMQIQVPLVVQPEIILSSSTVLQGEPIMVVLDGLAGTSTIQEITFDGQPLNIFLYQSKPTAFIGIDLYKKPGIYVLKTTLTGGQILKKNITVLERKKVFAPLGIPAKLGGNTPTSQKNLVNSLGTENQILAQLKTANQSYWSMKFKFPIVNPIVTDPYGYLRQTGSYDIAHKGTDFKALPGTSVMAINRGVVRLVKNFPTYGNTIVIDHGAGLMSFYMHLSKVDVREGQSVEQSQIIGESGETGYTEGAHLHLTIRIDGVSIDPMKFMNFFQ